MSMMTDHRCCHCSRRLNALEVQYYEFHCNECERELQTRVHPDRYPNAPSRFAQRVAIVLAITIILTCVVMMKHFGGPK